MQKHAFHSFGILDQHVPKKTTTMKIMIFRVVAITRQTILTIISAGCHFNKCLLTSSASKPPGITVPSFEQKQYGNMHSAGSHFFAKSIGVSVIGAGAGDVIRYATKQREGRKRNGIKKNTNWQRT